MEVIDLWVLMLVVFAFAAVGVLKLVEYYQDRKR
jgi:hypothetical protein